MGNLKMQLRYLAFLGVVVAVVEFTGRDLFASPPPPICSEMCGSSSCEETCYVDMMEFGNGNDITCLEYGSWDGSPCCGDGVCEGDEGGNEEMTGPCAADCPGPIVTCGECSVETQNCGGGAVCVRGGCCVTPCDGSECGEHERTCEASAQCYDTGDCCDDEVCLRNIWVDEPDPTPDHFLLWSPTCVPWPTSSE